LFVNVGLLSELNVVSKIIDSLSFTWLLGLLSLFWFTLILLLLLLFSKIKIPVLFI